MLQDTQLTEVMRATIQECGESGKPKTMKFLENLLSIKYVFKTFKKRRRVAQLGRALAWGARGRWFKSSRADQNKKTA